MTDITQFVIDKILESQDEIEENVARNDSQSIEVVLAMICLDVSLTHQQFDGDALCANRDKFEYKITWRYNKKEGPTITINGKPFQVTAKSEAEEAYDRAMGIL